MNITLTLPAAGVDLAWEARGRHLDAERAAGDGLPGEEDVDGVQSHDGGHVLALVDLRLIGGRDLYGRGVLLALGVEHDDLGGAPELINATLT